MSNHPAPGSTLALQALLFCSDVLPDEDRASFELRLAGDQQAREAVALAAELVQTCAAEPVSAPNPLYRSRLKERFLPRPGLWSRLARHRPQPLAWTMVGAAAASLLFLLLMPPQSTSVMPVQPMAVTDITPTAPPEQEQLEHARLWEELPRGQHLLKAHEEERRRRNRHDLSLRLVKRDDSSDVSAIHQ